MALIVSVIVPPASVSAVRFTVWTLHPRIRGRIAEHRSGTSSGAAAYGGGRAASHAARPREDPEVPMHAERLTPSLCHHAEGPYWSPTWAGLRWVEIGRAHV